MIGVDYLVLTLYMLGVLAVGLLFARLNRSASDMFAAGGQSPWWASGLSGFMTMFSAGTFVVWGGIAYKFGFVAVAINLCYGVAALAVGYFVAGRWKRLGIRTPAQFIGLRYGRTALHFYTWSMMVFRIVGVAVAMYSLAVVLVALMPLGEGNPLRDPATGHMSLTWAIVIFGGIVVVYTMVGGLWAVLMTDVLQFIVLNLAVIFVVPLMFMRTGGVAGFVQDAPPNFFHLTGGGYTWIFLAGWCAIHFFMVGADWAFVQRFICVPNERDARKSSYLFGVLYLVSPLLWLLPPLIWRVRHPLAPGATSAEIDHAAEQAYIMACQSVLPAGMVGLMVAAMFSATASMVSSQLNVFAGVLTSDIYERLINPQATQRRLVWIGRVFTVVLGATLLGIALAIPYLGGAEKVIVGITSLLVGPLMAPTLWGLFFRRINAKAVFITSGVCFAAGFLVKYGIQSQWLTDHAKTMDILLGVALPVVVLEIIRALGRSTSAGWQRVENFETAERAAAVKTTANRLPAIVVAWAMGLCGLLMAGLAINDPEDRGLLALFAITLWALAATVYGLSWWRFRAMQQEVSHAAS
ncbi:Na+:solute symporter [Planctomycetales bacterium ZRK34]|nr:Na+:solute symporter [Planctomycetales bacterium ZRK34]